MDKVKFLEKYQKVPVIEYQNNVSKDPIVSVIVQTYQQVDYIAKCLDGILMQKTSFDIEILVGEDDSSDGTREICLKYAKKFPEKIKLFLHSRANNIKVYGNPSGLFNFKYNVYNSTGKYIAICEGDDFWIDSVKLQKQIDFLELNDAYGMLYSDINMIDGKGKEIKSTRSYEKVKSRYKSGSIFWELLNHNFINTLTVCMRKKIVMDYYNNFDEIFFYDYRLWLHFATHSKIKYVNEKWAAYRIHDNGVSRSNGFFNKRKPLVRKSAMLKYLQFINYNKKLLNRKVLSKTSNFILRNKHISLKEKAPIILLLKKHPAMYFFLVKWRTNNFLTRITNKLLSK